MTDPGTNTSPKFSVRVSNGLYLDSNNRFHSGPLPSTPVYDLGGGVLSLSAEVSGQVVSGVLAVLPLKGEEAWKGKLRNLGLDDASIEIFGKTADFASNIVTVVGWAQAALKIAEMLGILKSGKSVEQLAQEILTKLGIVQDMVADAQGHQVHALLDTSAANIEGLRDQAEGLMNSLNSRNFVERRAIRKEILDKAGLVDIEIRAMLTDSRWQLFNQSKQYTGSWAFMTDPEETTLRNPPWWGTPRFVPRKRLDDDGVSWVDVVYPAAYKLRFDYRAALPFLMHGVLSYTTMLTMAEPEFRSTGRAKRALEAYVASIDLVLKNMLGVFARSHYDAWHFKWAGEVTDVVTTDPDGIFGPEPPTREFKRPHFYWQVGALDFCAYTDSYFTQLAGSLADQQGLYKLGTVDFDWIPPDAQLEFVAGGFPPDPILPVVPHWEITNPQECADAANQQAEADFIVLLQASGYFQLAQLQATLRHLTTDPDRSETVSGRTRIHRQQMDSTRVEITGYSGLLCHPADVTSTGARVDFECRTATTLSIQPPDRVDPIPMRYLLVAMSAPADVRYAVVMSEVLLHEGAAQVALPAADTFDLYVSTTKDGGLRELLSRSELAAIAATLRIAVPYTDINTKGAAHVWSDITDNSSELPKGEIRNRSTGPVGFNVTMEASATDSDRQVVINVTTDGKSRNARYVYVVAEEKLGSGNILRTYFELDSTTQVTFLPGEFFVKERDCLKKTTDVVDYINNHFAESAPQLAPGVPITVNLLQEHVAALRVRSPEILQRAVLAVSQNG